MSAEPGNNGITEMDLLSRILLDHSTASNFFSHKTGVGRHDAYKAMHSSQRSSVTAADD